MELGGRSSQWAHQITSHLFVKINLKIRKVKGGTCCLGHCEADSIVEGGHLMHHQEGKKTMEIAWNLNMLIYRCKFINLNYWKSLVPICFTVSGNSTVFLLVYCVH